MININWHSSLFTDTVLANNYTDTAVNQAQTVNWKFVISNFVDHVACQRTNPQLNRRRASLHVMAHVQCDHRSQEPESQQSQTKNEKKMTSFPKSWYTAVARSFAVNGPVVWNSLPTERRSPDISLAVVWNSLPTERRSPDISLAVVWNSLPTELRSPDISLDVFKARLITFLFNRWLSAFWCILF